MGYEFDFFLTKLADELNSAIAASPSASIIATVEVKASTFVSLGLDSDSKVTAKSLRATLAQHFKAIICGVTGGDASQALDSATLVDTYED